MVDKKKSSNSKNTTKKIEKEFKNVTKKWKLEFKSWFSDAYKVILTPKKYFSSIVEDGNYEDPIIKAAFYGLITAVLMFIINTVKIGFTFMSLINLVVYPIIAVILTFGLAGVLLFFAYVCKGEMDFEAAVKAVASKIFIYPLSILLLTVGSFSFYVTWIITILIMAYILFLMYVAVIYCLNADVKVANIVFITLAVLYALSQLYVLRQVMILSQFASAAKQLSNGLGGLSF